MHHKYHMSGTPCEIMQSSLGTWSRLLDMQRKSEQALRGQLQCDKHRQGRPHKRGPKQLLLLTLRFGASPSTFFQYINAREQHPAWASPRAAAFAFGAAFACAFGAIDNYRIRPSTTLLKSAACAHEISKHVQVCSSDKDIKQTMKTKTNVASPVNPLLSNVAALWASGGVNGHQSTPGLAQGLKQHC